MLSIDWQVPIKEAQNGFYPTMLLLQRAVCFQGERLAGATPAAEAAKACPEANRACSSPIGMSARSGSLGMIKVIVSLFKAGSRSVQGRRLVVGDGGGALAKQSL
jgi:hypothetical protein